MKKSEFFVTLFVRREFFQHLRSISTYSVLNKISEYIYYYILKTLLYTLLLLVFKFVEIFQCILNYFKLQSTWALSDALNGENVIEIT